MANLFSFQSALLNKALCYFIFYLRSFLNSVSIRFVADAITNNNVKTKEGY